MKVMMLAMGDSWECHKDNCQDIVKKSRGNLHAENSWVEDSLAEAEVNFEYDLGDLGYNWSQDVKVLPCAKEGA